MHNDGVLCFLEKNTQVQRCKIASTMQTTIVCVLPLESPSFILFQRYDTLFDVFAVAAAAAVVVFLSFITLHGRQMHWKCS